MKWPFSRNKNVDGVPLEIQEYYQTERRERAGVAWLLALGTLLITVGLATLLFFGGRWAYRKIADRNDSKDGQTSQVAQSPGESTDDQSASGDSGEDSSTGTSSTSTSVGNTAGRASTPAAGADLPDTGPGDVVAIFTVATSVSALAHYTFTRRNE